MSERVDEMRRRAAQFERRATIYEAREQEGERKRETRKKILLGAAALSLNDAQLIERLVARLSDRDRRLFLRQASGGQ